MAKENEEALVGVAAVGRRSGERPSPGTFYARGGRGRGGGRCQAAI